MGAFNGCLAMKKPGTALTPRTAAPVDNSADALYAQIHDVLQQARRQAKRSINQTMVQAYWQVGKLIVEHEQGGEDRAAYGANTLQLLADRLGQEFGRGFSAPNLRNFRQFFLTYTQEEICYTPCSELGWSHFRLLMRVADPAARQWYAREAVSQTWSVAALDRQISTLYYQRLLSSQDQAAVKSEAATLIEQNAPPHPRDFIRDPYILEFLDGQPQASWCEKDVEQGLLDQLQKFLLELGKGFAFVARQRHLRIEDEDAFVDLVFYNYILNALSSSNSKWASSATRTWASSTCMCACSTSRFARRATTPPSVSSCVRSVMRPWPATRCWQGANKSLPAATSPGCPPWPNCKPS